MRITARVPGVLAAAAVVATLALPTATAFAAAAPATVTGVSAASDPGTDDPGQPAHKGDGKGGLGDPGSISWDNKK
ncbi:hypothetical protein [Kitasatospora sp. NPDC085464]|uniref:hypothetical protein n=1 Tax=Kitasatospora sp. NPDC085464 TaxID=3364063 RepID=UPI0037C7E684